MDIAYYVSELLGELGEVNVPGLGNFSQRKIDGYYNDEEARFYPPANAVHFNPNFEEDDILAEYIAEKKKISLASSKYFTEKYVNSVKQEAILRDVPLADMGSIRFVVHEFNFKSSGIWANDPLYFGYPKIELKKLTSTAFLDQVEAFNQAPKDEIPQPAILKELIQEPETVTADTTATEPELSVVKEVPPTEPEIKSELPAVIAEPGLTALIPESPEPVDETPLPVLSEEPVKETEELMLVEPVKAPEPSEFDLEAYLRELEASAGTESTEQHTAEPELTTEPLTVEPEYEVIIPDAETTTPQPEQENIIEEPEIDVPKTEIELEEAEQKTIEPEPEINAPEPESYLPLPTVELPGYPYAPDPELQQYILDSTPVKSEPVAYVPLTPLQPQTEEDFVFDGKGYDNVDNQPSNRSYLWLWITLPILLILGAAAGYIWYQHQQRVMKMIKANAVPIPLKTPLKQDTLKTVPADSLKNSAQNSVITDTTEKAVTTPVTAAVTASTIDSTKIRYELIGLSAKTLREANNFIRNYKSLGFDSHIAIGAPGRRLKISLGTFSSHAQAVQKQRELLKTGKVKKDIYVLPINPKK